VEIKGKARTYRRVVEGYAGAGLEGNRSTGKYFVGLKVEKGEYPHLVDGDSEIRAVNEYYRYRF
jgi:hypothetical protein